VLLYITVLATRLTRPGSVAQVAPYQAQQVGRMMMMMMMTMMMVVVVLAEDDPHRHHH
jgi:hypothetical protein